MTLVMVDIDMCKAEKTDWFNTPGIQDYLFDLDEYLQIARKTIGAFSTPSMRRAMNNDDAVAYVADRLMIGTCRWVKGGKRGSHRGYLMACAKWAIKTWGSKFIQLQNHEWHDISLSHEAHVGSRLLVHETIADPKAKTPAENLETPATIYVQNLIGHANLTDQQREYVQCVHVEGLSASETARRVGVSRERVRQVLEAAMPRLREAAYANPPLN